MIEEKVRTIRLYGNLSKFGRVHKAVVSNTQEAVNYLSNMIPGFQKEMMSSKDRGIAYACFIGKTNINEDQLDWPAGDEDIRIAPIIMGSKSGGLFSVVLGVALIFAAPYLAAAAFSAGSVGLAVGIANYGALLGGALALTGAAQMLSPTASNTGTSDRPDNGASYNFNGAVNTVAQGNPWPMAYGSGIGGGAAVSVAVYSEDAA